MVTAIEQLINTKVKNDVFKKFASIEELGLLVQMQGDISLIKHRIENRFDKKFFDNIYKEYFDDINLKRLIKGTFEETIMNNLDKKDFKDFQEWFRERVSQVHNKESLIITVISDIMQMASNPVVKHGKQVMSLKTSCEFSHYLSNPMGMNEFLRKIVDEDILQIEELR